MNLVLPALVVALAASLAVAALLVVRRGAPAGFGSRFGLLYVDFETLERIPKLSAEWSREVARQNAVA